MDPFTGFIIGVLVVTGALKVGVAAATDAVTTARASKAGQWDLIDADRERRAAARQAWARAWAERRTARHRQAGGDGAYRPGVREYARDLYHGFWEDRLDRRGKKRAARPEWVYDPDRPSLARRFDAAVLGKVQQVRASRGWETVKEAVRHPLRPVPTKAERQATETAGQEPPAAPTLGEQAAAPGYCRDDEDDTNEGEAMRRGTDHFVTAVADGWSCTCGDSEGGLTAREAQAEAEHHAEYFIDRTGEHPAITHLSNGGATMSIDTTPAAAAATDVQDNEAARRNFQLQLDAAGDAADALAAYEAALARLAAAAAAGEGMEAQGFDRGASAAQAAIADQIPGQDIAAAVGGLEEIRANAEAGVKALEKYRDAEDLVNREQVSGKTLETANSA